MESGTPTASGGPTNLVFRVTDAAAATVTKTLPITVSPAGLPLIVLNSGEFFPDFGAHPTVTAVASGNWSSGSTWSTGAVPAAGDVVSVPAGKTVTYDANSSARIDTVTVSGTLIFSTGVTTVLTLTNLLVRDAGTLTVGTLAAPITGAASIVFADTPFDHAVDPGEWGHGLIATGKVTMYGLAKTPFLKLAAEIASTGAASFTLASTPTAWANGDTLLLPDSHQLTSVEVGVENSNFAGQWETRALTSRSGAACTVPALAYKHQGSRDLDGAIEFLPDVANLTRNVSVRSESASGVRGRVHFTGRADVDIQYVSFGGLGRTRGLNTAGTATLAVDSTTYNANRTVLHQGTNIGGRFAVYFSHLMGPVTPQGNGYQWTFANNVVQCPLTPMPYRWGVSINDSHYGLFQKNVLYNWYGCGVVTETANETGNVIDSNLVVRVQGYGGRDDPAIEGIGFWIKSPNNRLTNNIAASVCGNPYGVGFRFGPEGAVVQNVKIPKTQGSDTTQSGGYNLVEVHTIPILEWTNSETYGCAAGGLSMWGVGSKLPSGHIPTDSLGGTATGFKFWSVWSFGSFFYPNSRVTFVDYVARGRGAGVTASHQAVNGFQASDYYCNSLTFDNANIQGFSYGFVSPARGHNTTTLKNSYLRNTVNVSCVTPWDIYGGEETGYFPRSLVLSNNVYAAPPSTTFNVVELKYNPADSRGHHVLVSDTIFLNDYPSPGDHLQVYYTQQVGSYVVPANGTVVPFSNAPVIGSLVPGDTNTQLLAANGTCIAGVICPVTTTTAAVTGAYTRAF